MIKMHCIRAVLLAAYCIPFAYLSVNGDAVFGTLWYYGLMVTGFVLLCWCAMRTKNTWIVYIGCVLSFISSCTMAKVSGLESMGHYFKPFTSYMIIAAISIISSIVQIAVAVLYEKSRKQ